VGDARAVYSVGCIGHGVSTTLRDGQIIRDLILERKTELTDLWFVNRRAFSWPPESLRFIASAAVRGSLQVEDWHYERNQEKAQL